MRLLDLFCCEGGAAMGYHRAGFDEIVGVDIKPQKRYPFQFVQGDALEYLRNHGHEFDAIHASPPCQGYSRSRNNGSGKNAPLLVDDTRAMLLLTGIPFIIENVIGAPMYDSPLFGVHVITLCGASFGLKTGEFDLARHRLFESNIPLESLPCKHKRGQTIGVYGNGTNSWHREKFGRCITIAEMRETMGIGWMSRPGLSQAIPPAYTEFVGRQLIAYITHSSVRV